MTLGMGTTQITTRAWLPFYLSWASLVARLVKNPPAVQETWVQSLGREDPLEKGKATHSSILAWRIPWTVYSPWGHKESDTTEQLSLHFNFTCLENGRNTSYPRVGRPNPRGGDAESSLARRQGKVGGDQTLTVHVVMQGVDGGHCPPASSCPVGMCSCYFCFF